MMIRSLVIPTKGQRTEDLHGSRKGLIYAEEASPADCVGTEVGIVRLAVRQESKKRTYRRSNHLERTQYHSGDRFDQLRHGQNQYADLNDILASVGEA